MGSDSSGGTTDSGFTSATPPTPRVALRRRQTTDRQTDGPPRPVSDPVSDSEGPPPLVSDSDSESETNEPARAGGPFDLESSDSEAEGTDPVSWTEGPKPEPDPSRAGGPKSEPDLSPLGKLRCHECQKSLKDGAVFHQCRMVKHMAECHGGSTGLYLCWGGDCARKHVGCSRPEE
jgi:hypothetical protein